MSHTHAQLQCTKQGGPFEVAQVPTPKPGPGQVLLRIKTVALNPVDVKQRNFGLFVPSWPYVFGIEGAGVVEAVGENVTNVKPGDEVAGYIDVGIEGSGSYQENTLTSASGIAKKPRNISLEEAAALPIGYVTAVAGVWDVLGIPLPNLPSSNQMPAFESIAVLGGSSTVGGGAIQLLRLACPSATILATSSKAHYQRLTELGASKVFDYHSTTVVSDIKAATPGGKGVDLVLDCVGAGAKQEDIANIFSPAGLKKYAAVITGVQIPDMEGIEKLNVDGSDTAKGPGGDKVIPSLTELVESGKYKVPVQVKVVGNKLEDIPNVMDQSWQTSGQKLVVNI